MVIDGCQGAAQEPAGRVTHGNGDDLIPYPAHDEQINLAEYDEGTQHDDHGCLAVTGTPECAGINLVETAEDIERSDPAQEHRAVFHDLRFAVEECHDLRCKFYNGNHQNCRGAERKDQSMGDTLLGTLYLITAQILADEGCGCQCD